MELLYIIVPECPLTLPGGWRFKFPAGSQRVICYYCVNGHSWFFFAQPHGVQVKYFTHHITQENEIHKRESEANKKFLIRTISNLLLLGSSRGEKWRTWFLAHIFDGWEKWSWIVTGNTFLLFRVYEWVPIHISGLHQLLAHMGAVVYEQNHSLW